MPLTFSPVGIVRISALPPLPPERAAFLFFFGSFSMQTFCVAHVCWCVPSDLMQSFLCLFRLRVAIKRLEAPFKFFLGLRELTREFLSDCFAHHDATPSVSLNDFFLCVSFLQFWLALVLALPFFCLFFFPLWFLKSGTVPYRSLCICILVPRNLTPFGFL